MSAWLFALAGWLLAFRCAWGWLYWKREHDAVDEWHADEFKRRISAESHCLHLNRELSKAEGAIEWAEIQMAAAHQQALDDHAACDAMREELQRMKGKKQ